MLRKPDLHDVELSLFYTIYYSTCTILHDVNTVYQ
jgi:hypothetical protein